MQYIDIDKLKPHPTNPRKISKRDLKKLCESLEKNKEYFEARPIITNKHMVIYAGNSRYKAAKELGYKQVPVHVMDLPETKMQEIMIRDNINNGQWDESIIAEYDFKFLEDCGMQIQGLDYNEDEPEQQEKSDKKKNKLKKVVTCPHCAQDFEL
jgi:ParB-like chromosome segregation protein Spo0J